MPTALPTLAFAPLSRRKSIAAIAFSSVGWRSASMSCGSSGPDITATSGVMPPRFSSRSDRIGAGLDEQAHRFDVGRARGANQREVGELRRRRQEARVAIEQVVRQAAREIGAAREHQLSTSSELSAPVGTWNSPT